MSSDNNQDPHHHHVIHQSSLNLVKRWSKREHAVGVFDSHQYLEIEAMQLHDLNSDACTAWTVELLSEQWVVCRFMQATLMWSLAVIIFLK